MSKKEYLRKIFVFQPYECVAVEEFLMKMASEGWMLDSIKGRGSTPYIFVFQKMQPKKLTFSVDYFQKATIFEEQPYIPTLDYIEYCKQEGWHHVSTKGKMQVFYTERKDIVPIQTDERLKFKAINNAFLMQSSYILLPFLFIWILFFQINSNFENLVTRYNWLISMTIYVLILIVALVLLAHYIKWLINSKNRLKIMGKLQMNSRKQKITAIHLNVLFLSIPFIILYTLSPKETIYKVIYITILLAVGILLLNDCYYEKRNHSIRMNKFIFLSIILLQFYIFIMINQLIYFSYNDNKWTTDKTMEYFIATLPMDEQIDIRYNGLNTNIQETFLAQFSTYTYYYYFNNEENSRSVKISVFDSPYEWIINKYINDRISDTKYDVTFHEGDPVPWEADTLYQVSGEHNGWKDIIIIVYEDKVLVFETQLEIPYTSKNIEIIKRGLQENAGGLDFGSKH